MSHRNDDKMISIAIEIIFLKIHYRKIILLNKKFQIKNFKNGLKN